MWTIYCALITYQFLTSFTVVDKSTFVMNTISGLGQLYADGGATAEIEDSSELFYYFFVFETFSFFYFGSFYFFADLDTFETDLEPDFEGDLDTDFYLLLDRLDFNDFWDLSFFLLLESLPIDI